MKVISALSTGLEPFASSQRPVTSKTALLEEY